VEGVVRNRPDGSVEAEGVGRSEALEQFVAALRRGPAHARVEQVVEEWFERDAASRGFRISG